MNVVRIRQFGVGLLVGWFSLVAAARAELRIAIQGVGSRLYPIAVTAFEGEQKLPQTISEVIRADLTRSGRFAQIEEGSLSPEQAQARPFEQWRDQGANAVVQGSITRLTGQNYEVRFTLTDVLRQRELGGLAIMATTSSLRASAHRAADYIYEKLLGEAGVFSSRLSYVVQARGRYQLQVADADGKNVQIALSSAEPIISPVWSPDGQQIAYVSFEDKKPVVYLHSMTTGQRRVLANYKGNNSAPSWSPDGKKIALALSVSGNTQIYSIDIAASELRRLSNSMGIDTEPQFSPDGRSIYFTSDRSGAPQIYRMSVLGEVEGGPARRLTFGARYSAAPRVSPDGQSIAYVSQIDNAFRLHLQTLTDQRVRPLSRTSNDDSPSFAANGKFLLYSTQVEQRPVLATVSLDGRLRQLLSVPGGAVRYPSWGPSINLQESKK